MNYMKMMKGIISTTMMKGSNFLFKIINYNLIKNKFKRKNLLKMIKIL